MEILKRDIDIYYRIWDDVKEPLAYLQLIHGMVEHIGRYDEFARFLNSKDIVVVGMDIRGHGQTGSNIRLGEFAKEDGWSKVLEDQRALCEKMKGKYKGLPAVVLGHSMGSFLTRNLINLHPDLFDYAIIMGTGSSHGPSRSIARFLLKFLNPSKDAVFMDKMAFGSFNKIIKNPRTSFDWISRDPIQVDKYIADDLCGFMVKNSFYRDFMGGMKQVTDLEKQASFTKDILFVSGDRDPVGDMGKGVIEACKNYKKSGYILYEGMRHEILNEKDKYKVYNDIYMWIKGKVMDDKSRLAKNIN